MGDDKEVVVRNRQIVLQNYLEAGSLKESDLILKTSSIALKVPQDCQNAGLVKNLYLSMDPYLCHRMTNKDDNFIPPFHLGEVIAGGGVARVIDSTHPNFKKGDLIRGMIRWEEYTLFKDSSVERINKIHHTDFPVSYHTGVLGMSGLSAYVGFYEILCPKEGETIFVSAASGTVGQLVGQFAKLKGCYVVGSAGTQEKVNLLKDKFGYDDAFNYKDEPDLKAALKRYFPNGIDMYFENVGGRMLDAVLVNMRKRGRIVTCGMISQYNLEIPEGVQNLFNLVSKSIRMEGFLCTDYTHLDKIR